MGRKSEREEFLGDRGLDMRGNKGHHILKKKPTKQHGKETVERKTEGKRSRIGK